MTPRSSRIVVRADARKEIEVKYEGDKGPRELAQNVVNQCQVFSSSVKRMQAQASKEEAAKALVVHAANKSRKEEKTENSDAYTKLDAEGARMMDLVESFMSQVSFLRPLRFVTIGK